MLFTRNKQKSVSSFLTKLLNNNCLNLRCQEEGPRTDSRVNLSVIVLIIPLEKKKLDLAKAFHAVSKDFSATSVSVMVDVQRPLDEVIVAFRFEGEMYYAQGKAKHLSPQGGGFHQLGFQLEKMVTPAIYPELAKISF